MKKNLIFKVFLILFLVLPVVSRNIFCRDGFSVPDSLLKSFRLFEDDSLLVISLRFDMNTYLRKKPTETYLKAGLTIHLSKTDSLYRDIRLRTRGIFRNSYCFFPPIELNLKKANFGYSDLNRISKIKMVPHCKSGSENEKYLLKEYLIYKMFNMLTDTSFRVRLLQVTYIDTQNKRKSLTQYGFLIEPLEMLEARTNSVQVYSKLITQKNIKPYEMDRLAIFNYMIGNYDWAVPGQHNIRVIKPLVLDPSNLGIALPYDFDWTGMVNAMYAIPVEEVGIKSVRERLFLGVCRTEEVYEKDLEIFLEKKEEFYRLISEFPYLNQKAKREMTGYLDEFYFQATGRKSILDVFVNSCKNF